MAGAAIEFADVEVAVGLLVVDADELLVNPIGVFPRIRPLEFFQVRAALLDEARIVLGAAVGDLLADDRLLHRLAGEIALRIMLDDLAVVVIGVLVFGVEELDGRDVEERLLGELAFDVVEADFLEDAQGVAFDVGPTANRC